MQPEQLEVGAMYFYQGDLFRHTEVRFDSVQPTFFGKQYVFEIMPQGWTVGGGYRLSKDSLKDLVKL